MASEDTLDPHPLPAARDHSPLRPRLAWLAVVFASLLMTACMRPLGAWFESEEADPEPPSETPVWPQWGGGPGRTGQSPHVGPHEGTLVSIPLVPPRLEDEPEVTHVLPGAIDARGLVYAVARDADNSGWLFGIGSDLEPFWAYRPPYGSVSGLPVVTADGTLIVESRDETLHGPMSEWYLPSVLAVTPALGESWTFHPESEALCSQYFVTSQPLAAPDGTVLLALRSGSVENRLHALWPDGRSRWTWSRSAGWRTSTALGPDGTLYALISEGSGSRIFALGPEGQTRWIYQGSDLTGLGFLGLLSVDSEGRLHAAGEGKLYTFSSAGHLIWSAQSPEPTVTAGIAVAPDGSLYLGTQTAPSGEESVTGWLHAYSPEGTELWSRSFDTVPCGIPVVDAEGTVYSVGRAVDTGQKSEILALTATGQVRFRKPFEDALMPCGQGDEAWYISSPMLDAGGRLWLGSHSNRLLVVTR